MRAFSRPSELGNFSFLLELTLLPLLSSVRSGTNSARRKALSSMVLRSVGLQITTDFSEKTSLVRFFALPESPPSFPALQSFLRALNLSSFPLCSHEEAGSQLLQILILLVSTDSQRRSRRSCLRERNQGASSSCLSLPFASS